MPDPRHGFGIVGCGMIAEFHTRAINEIDGSRVLAVFDTVPERAAKIAALAGPHCQVYDHLDRMLAHPGLDVVCVCTPSGAHMDAGGQGGAGGQASRGREAARDHRAPLRCDHRRL